MRLFFPHFLIQFLDFFPRFLKLGAEGHGFLIVAQGSFLHVVLQALVAHVDVFAGIFHEGLLLFECGGTQGTVFFAQTVDDVQLAADEALGSRALDVVARMDGLEELREKGVKVATVESLGCGGILHVGLCLLQGAVDGLAVVEAFGELYNFGADKDIGTADGLS